MKIGSSQISLQGPGRATRSKEQEPVIRILKKNRSRPRPSCERARIAAALGDRAGAATLVHDAVARGYAYDGITHADAELGPLFP